jgi:predicted SnoaL-like aldol condensation-catalyzing enzyme
MNKPPVNNQLLIDYLLNSLPAEQTEEIDELSFTDDQFAGELAAAERDLVDAYIQGELPDSALKKFETHYLASPHRREKVVFARALQEAAKVETTAFIQKNSGASQSKQRLSEFFINIFGGFKPVQWGYAAATLLILIIGGWFVIQSWQRATQSDDTQARRTASETPPTNKFALHLRIIQKTRLHENRQTQTTARNSQNRFHNLNRNAAGSHNKSRRTRR